MKAPLIVASLFALFAAWQTQARPQHEIPTSDIAKFTPPQAVEPCLKEARRRDFDLDEHAAPPADFSDWLTTETTQIPWKVQIKDPELRFDQRYEASYSVTVQGKDLGKSGAQEILYTSAVTDSDNKQILQPRWSRHTFDADGANDLTFQFTDCVFVQPGTYFVWMAVYEPKSAHHSVAKRRIRAQEFSADLLPNANSPEPAAEFPDVTGSSNAPETPSRMLLPISNKQSVAVQLVSTLSPLDQWDGRDDISRAINNHVLSAVGIFSQLQLAAGSLSAIALDSVNQRVVFQQDGFNKIDWPELSSKFTDARSLHTLTLSSLQAKSRRSAFLLDALAPTRTSPNEPLRVVILISGSLLFERGYDASLKSEPNCRCRFYHVRMQVSKNDVFDDLGKQIKTVRPRTFDVLTAQDFRKALVAIVDDLNHL